MQIKRTQKNGSSPLSLTVLGTWEDSDATSMAWVL